LIQFTNVERKFCPSCNEKKAKFLGMRGGKFQREGLGIASKIFQCANCSLIYPNPFPFPESLESLYGDTDDYFSKKDSWEVRSKSYESLVQDFINRIDSEAKTIELLDIGAGRGEFCQAAISFSNVKCTGIEVSEGSIRYAKERGIALYQKSLNDLIDEGKTYDGICLNAVLAHVHEPGTFFEETTKLLKKGGYIYIDTPNEPNLLTIIGNSLNKLVGKKSIFNLNPTWQPYAVYGFNKQALTMLCKKNNIEIENIVVHGDPVIPLAGGLSDKAKSLLGISIQKLANLLSLGTNMYVWGKKI
jgi:2-polyprenyl-3-methyl-5-hydroxy-6-metoxy-1,4-benzoquinol methylase